MAKKKLLSELTDYVDADDLTYLRRLYHIYIDHCSADGTFDCKQVKVYNYQGLYELGFSGPERWVGTILRYPEYVNLLVAHGYVKLSSGI